jgi:ornithine--oxo-acid transaminase
LVPENINKTPAARLMTSFDPAAIRPPEHTPERFIEIERKHGVAGVTPLSVVMARARGSWLQDTEGRRYVDMLSSLSATNQGHRHPEIVAALKAQVDRLTLTSSALHNDQSGPFLARLSTLTGFDAVLPVSGGAEAVAMGIRAVRQWAHKVKGITAGHAEVIVTRGHRLSDLNPIGGPSVNEGEADACSPGFRTVPFGDAEALGAAIGSQTAAVMLEPISVDGGVIIPPNGYLERVRQLCDEHQVLLFIDELQTGLGRTGKMFAFEHSDIRPDCMVVGRSLGGGVYPVSAFVADRAIMDTLDLDGCESTCRGNPLAAAVSMASLDVIEKEGLVERSARLGEDLLTAIKAMDSPHVQDVRGLGLLVAIEIKTRSGTGRAFCESLLERRVIAKDTRPQVIQLTPPLTIDEIDLSWAVERLKEVLL